MKKQIVLITGTSKGLGKILAQKFPIHSYKVYSGIRRKNSEAKGTIPVYLDLAKKKSLKESVDHIINREGKIDILIHNAAIAYWGAADSLSFKEAQELFQINFFGPWHLTQLILPYMRKERFGKIIFISSIRAVESCPFMGMYSASKAALEAVAFDWAISLLKWNISVSVIEPGPLSTGIELKHGTYFSRNKKNPYLPYPETSFKSQSPEEVANSIIKHIEKKVTPFRSQTSKTSRETIGKHLKDPSGMQWYKEQKNWLFKWIYH